MKKVLLFIFAVLLIQITQEAVGDCNDSINPGEDAKKCHTVDIGTDAKCCLIKYTASSEEKFNCKRLPSDSLEDDQASAYIKDKYGLDYIDHDCSSRFLSHLTKLGISFVIALFF